MAWALDKCGGRKKEGDPTPIFYKQIPSSQPSAEALPILSPKERCCERQFATPSKQFVVVLREVSTICR